MIKRRKYYGIVIVTSLLFGLAACQNLNSPLDPVVGEQTSADLSQKSSSAPQRYIVTFFDPLNASAEQQIMDAGGEIVKQLQLIYGISVMLPEKAAISLRNSDNVRDVEIDRIVLIPLAGLSGNGKGGGGGKKPPKDDPPDDPQPPEELPWGVDRIDADRAWVASTGEAVKVGVIDTGIDPDHPDLTVAGGVNTVNTRKSYKDDNGHGTHVAGTIAAVDNEIGVVGVAPTVELYAIKAFNKRGMAFTSDIIEGIQWCIDNGIRVINMSFGSSSPSSSETLAIQAAYDEGIVMVAAAGNSGGSVGYPAAYWQTIAVSASDRSDAIADFSSRGPEVDLIAPGVNILSTYLEGAYAWGSGTSMATPHVAGAAALVIWTQPNLSPDGVKSHLALTAEDLELSFSEQGSGLVDAEAAVIAVIIN